MEANMKKMKYLFEEVINEIKEMYIKMMGGVYILKTAKSN